MSVRKLLDGIHSDSPLDLGALIRAHVGSELLKPSTRLPGNHPSEIGSTYFCRRKKMIKEMYDRFGVSYLDKPTEDLQYIFNIGHWLHDMVRQEYLGPAGILYGKWRCTGCGDLREGQMPSEECPCPGEQDTQWWYEETLVRIPEFDIVGHVDGLILARDGKTFIVLDIKTIKPDKFEELSRVLHSYRNQVTIYMRALGLKKAVLLFICKSTGQFKQFEVDYKEEVFQKIIQDNLIGVQEAIKNKKIIRKHQYCSPSSRMRSECPFAGPCTAGRTYKKIEQAVEELV